MPSTAMLEYALNSVKPVTFVLKNAKNLAPSTISGDGTVAIRIPKDEFCGELLALYGKPIVSTFANISGQPTPRICGDSKRNPGINGLYCSFSSR
jgi:L-threonylcarbamoyladenylate synthase